MCEAVQVTVAARRVFKPELCEAHHPNVRDGPKADAKTLAAVTPERLGPRDRPSGMTDFGKACAIGRGGVPPGAR
jgi:hypothetical protein